MLFLFYLRFVCFAEFLLVGASFDFDLALAIGSPRLATFRHLGNDYLEVLSGS